MVIQGNKPKAPKPNPEYEKENMLKALSQEPLPVIALAYSYAKNFIEVGYDVTKAWTTTQQQTAILEQVYKRGVDDTLGRIARGEIKV